MESKARNNNHKLKLQNLNQFLFNHNLQLLNHKLLRLILHKQQFLHLKLHRLRLNLLNLKKNLKDKMTPKKSKLSNLSQSSKATILQKFFRKAKKLIKWARKCWLKSCRKPQL